MCWLPREPQTAVSIAGIRGGGQERSGAPQVLPKGGKEKVSEQSHQLTFNPNPDLLPVKYSSLAPGVKKKNRLLDGG